MDSLFLIPEEKSLTVCTFFYLFKIYANICSLTNDKMEFWFSGSNWNYKCYYMYNNIHFPFNIFFMIWITKDIFPYIHCKFLESY